MALGISPCSRTRSAVCPSIAGTADGIIRRPPNAPIVFAHPSERELARILDFYRVPWRYEPDSFVLRAKGERVLEMFSPDFYLPELDLYLELTTLRQRLVTKKNRKLRLLRELYPDISEKGVEIVGIATGEEPETVRDFAAKRPYPWPILIDPEDGVSNALYVIGLPTLVITCKVGGISFLQTGVVEAGIHACETVDLGVRLIVEKVLELGGKLFVTADHGNCETMRNPDGSPHTAHTTNLVHGIYVAGDAAEFTVRDGILADVAPTLLAMLGLPQPPEMTGRPLLAKTSPA